MLCCRPLSHWKGVPKDEVDALNRFEFAKKLNKAKVMGSTENIYYESLHQVSSLRLAKVRSSTKMNILFASSYFSIDMWTCLAEMEVDPDVPDASLRYYGNYCFHGNKIV